MNLSTLRHWLEPALGWPLQIGMPGCGDGAAAARLVREGHQVFACDCLLAAVTRTRARSAEMLVDLAPADALPWPSHSLDLCAVPAGWNGAPAELMRVLRPGGAILVHGADGAMRRRLAGADIGWLDQFDGADGTWLGFMPARTGCARDAARGLSCCDPAA